MPVSLTDESDNVSSMAMTGFITLTANALFFAGYKILKHRKTKTKDREHKVAFAKYETKTDKVNEYLKANQIFYQSSFNNESKNRGLIIIEAYFGLSDHIYQIEAGMLSFKIPENASQYS